MTWKVKLAYALCDLRPRPDHRQHVGLTKGPAGLHVSGGMSGHAIVYMPPFILAIDIYPHI
jgi:hypothetical protein